MNRRITMAVMIVTALVVALIMPTYASAATTYYSSSGSSGYQRKVVLEFRQQDLLLQLRQHLVFRRWFVHAFQAYSDPDSSTDSYA